MKPQNHQSDCLNAVETERNQGKQRSLVVMASALGKTAVAAFDVKKFLVDFPYAKVLYLCHKNEILHQAKITFQTITQEKEELFGFLNGVEKNLKAKYLFATFQTMKENLKKFNPRDFDYVIVDESHHVVADTYQPVIEYFEPNFLLGMTATPNRLDLLDTKEIFGGTETFSLPLEKALVMGLLTKIDYHLITDEIIDFGKIENPYRMSLKELNRKIFLPKRDSEIVRIIAEKTKSIANPRIMIFCPSIKYAERLAKMIPDSLSVHSDQSETEQKNRIQGFRNGKISKILTVDKFNEGIDIPEVNVLVFLRSTSSPTIFFQQIGRGLRKADGKESVLILDFVANCERIEMIQEFVEKIKSAQKEHLENNDKTVEEPKVIDFGSFNFTEKATGVIEVMKKIKQGYTEETLIQQLQTLHKMLGRTPRAEDIYKASKEGWMASDKAFRRIFKTLNKARIAAGLPINKEEKYDEKTLIEQFKWLSEKLGRVPVTSDIYEYAEKGLIASTDSFLRTFKSLENLRELTGVEEYKPGFSKEFLLEKYFVLTEKLGRSPMVRDFDKASKEDKEMPSFRGYRRIFGNMDNLRKEAKQAMSEKNLVKDDLSKKQTSTLIVEQAEKKSRSTTRLNVDDIKNNMLLGLMDLWSYLKRKPDIEDVNIAAKEGKIALPNYEAYKVIFGGLDIALNLIQESNFS